MEQIKYSNVKDNKSIKFHLISCEIEHTGAANVSKFFEPAIVKKDEFQSDVSFRGRPLNGRKIKIEGDYLIASLKPSIKNEKEFLINELTNEFTYWNYDQKPDLDDNTNQAINWLKISKTLMNTVTTNDLNEFKCD